MFNILFIREMQIKFVMRNYFTSTKTDTMKKFTSDEVNTLETRALHLGNESGAATFPRILATYLKG